MNVKLYFCLLRSDVSGSYPYATKKRLKKDFLFGKKLNEMEQQESNHGIKLLINF